MLKQKGRATSDPASPVNTGQYHEEVRLSRFERTSSTDEVIFEPLGSGILNLTRAFGLLLPSLLQFVLHAPKKGRVSSYHR